MAKRVLIGKFPDGGYGLRVSKPGYDVTSNPVNNEQMVFNSDWQDILSIYAMGTLNSGGSYTHGLGYIPFVAGFINSFGNWEKLMPTNALFSRQESSSVSWGNNTTYKNSAGQDKSCSVASKTLNTYGNVRHGYANSGNAAISRDLNNNQEYIKLIEFRATNNVITFSSSAGGQLRYIIYRMKAFA